MQPGDIRQVHDAFSKPSAPDEPTASVVCARLDRSNNDGATATTTFNPDDNTVKPVGMQASTQTDNEDCGHDLISSLASTDLPLLWDVCWLDMIRWTIFTLLAFLATITREIVAFLLRGVVLLSCERNFSNQMLEGLPKRYMTKNLPTESQVHSQSDDTKSTGTIMTVNHSRSSSFDTSFGVHFGF